MDTEIIQSLLKERLTTADATKVAADRIGVSLATMYRYKSNPDSIPFGKLIELGRHLSFPIGGSATWSRTSVVQAEQRRAELEEGVAIPGGRRYVTTPAYTVNCELPEITELLWEIDYPTKSARERAEYLKLRDRRRQLYSQASYESFELFSAAGYRDFHAGISRFKAIPSDLRRRQIDVLIASLDWPHVRRRIHIRNSPELPMFSYFSTNVCLVRIDDIHIEFSGATIGEEFRKTFDDFFNAAELKSVDEVRSFLEIPQA